MTLQELLQARAALVDQQAALVATAQAANRTLTPEEEAQFEALETQIVAKDQEISALERHQTRVAAVAARQADLDKPATPPRRPDVSGVHNRAADRPWNHIGEMLHAVRAAAEPGVEPRHWDPRLKWQNAATGQNTSNPAEGGFLVHTEDAADLFALGQEASQLAPRCSPIDIGEGFNGTSIPAFDETSRETGSRWGGIRFYWREEAATVDPSKMKFRTIDLKLKGMMALVYATEENLQDAISLRSWIMRAFPEEFAWTLDDAIMNGNGVGKPLGFKSSPAFISVAKESGQAATTIVKKNIDKMYSRMWARSRQNSVWFINQDTEPELDNLTIEVGTGGAPVYLPPGGLAERPFATLKGRPVIPIEQCATLGTVGDIVLVDLSQYALARKDQLAMAESMHVRFLYAENVFRFMYRVDGKPLWNAALTPATGSSNTLSPFIGLATR